MRTIAIFLALAVSLPAAADEAGNWRLGMALGYGERGNPLIQSDDLPVALDIDIAWFGERFFFDNGDLGFTLADGERITTNVVARARSDRVFFGRTNTRLVTVSAAGNALSEETELRIPDRDYAVEMGVELLTDGRWGFLQINAFQDVGGVHDGFEVAADYGIGFAYDRWYVEPGLRASYKSRQLNDYYWGVRPDESSEALPGYVAGDGINWGARLRVSYHWNERWAFRMALDYERLNGEIADSPIVDQSAVVGYFAGVSYAF